MSMTLGPIHYWLYGKISNQEELTKFLAEGAREQGMSLSVSRYVRNLPPLEEIIDPMNIHGSLQAAIDDAEKRYADLVQDLLKMHVDPADLANCAQEFGKKHPVTVDTPEEVFRAFEDFFLDGMPCDHVNRVSDSSSASSHDDDTSRAYASSMSGKDNSSSVNGNNGNPFTGFIDDVLTGSSVPARAVRATMFFSILIAISTFLFKRDNNEEEDKNED